MLKYLIPEQVNLTCDKRGSTFKDLQFSLSMILNVYKKKGKKVKTECL